MQGNPTAASVRSFLSVIRDGDPPTEADLARAIDDLVIAYHHCPEGDVGSDEREPPARDYEHYKKRYETLARRFPGLGHYALADPTKPVDDEPYVGDAIDDLADIEGDLLEALWHFENVGSEQGYWYFRLNYEIHWGRHARELSLYLHARIW